MTRSVTRRLLIVLTTLLFALSGVAQVHAASSAAAMMPQTMDGSMADHGMDCGGKDKAAHDTCAAMCATVVAILGEPFTVNFVISAGEVITAKELPASGRASAPEPHPPKAG